MSNTTKIEKIGRPKKEGISQRAATLNRFLSKDLNETVELKKKHNTLHATATLIYKKRTHKKNRTVVLYCKVYYRGRESVAVSTGIKILPSETWDPKRCEVIGNAIKTKILRERRAEFEELSEKVRRDNIHFDAQILMNFFISENGYKNEKPLLLSGCAKYVAEIKSPRADAGLISQKTVEKYAKWIEVTEDFLVKTYNRYDIAFVEITPAFGDRLYTWLLTYKNYGNDYSRKVMSFLKAVLNYAVANAWVDRNPIAYQSWERSKRRILALNDAEMERVETTPILEQSLSVCRDVFLFQCYTGLAFADLSTLTAAHLFQSNEGQFFIRKSREKTNETSIIPLLPRCMAILKKYEDYAAKNGVLLPVLTNQKYNNKLKVLAEVSGISRFPLTTHIARKTCATQHLNNGVPLATVAGILGHATSRTTEQFYAVMREDTIVKNVFEHYKNKAV